MHPSRMCYILGGGLSVTPEILSLLTQRRAEADIIVINKAVQLIHGNYYITLDYSSTNRIGASYLRGLPHTTRIFVANMTTLIEKNGALTDAKHRLTYTNIAQNFHQIIYARGEAGISSYWHDFRCGNHSGHAALQYAALLGYTTICLVGFDYTFHGGKTHFHQGYNHNIRTFQTNLLSYLHDMKYAVEELTRVFPSVILETATESKLNDYGVPCRPLLQK